MRDYDELIERLRYCADRPICFSTQCDYRQTAHIGACFDSLKHDAADAIEELRSTAEHYRIAADDWFKEASLYKEKLAKSIDEIQRLKLGADTVYGYPVEQIVAFATACRRNGVEEKDLKTFASNAEFAYRAVEAETMAAFERAVLGKWKGRSD